MARIQLGLTDEDFFRLTPRQFHLLVDQHRERVEHQELLTGILASTIANWSMSAPKEGLAPSVFMPSRRDRPEQQKRTRLNRKKIAVDVRAFLNAQLEKQTT